MDDISSDARYLKQVSRVKHQILADYLEPWGKILGSAHQRLAYFDCFAGGGVYHDERQQPLPGSPLIALRIAKDYVKRHPGSSRLLFFAEKDRSTAERLRRILQSEPDVPQTVSYVVVEETAQDFVYQLIERVKSWGPGARLVPSFFFVDPYGHPVSIPVMRQILELGKTELLVNLMWFRINMHLDNPIAQPMIDQIFGHSNWNRQQFMELKGQDREKAFVDYFISQVGAAYALRFPFPFSPEDRVPAGFKRTKFYLLHFSSHHLAARLMKHVMWTANETIEDLRFSGYGPRQLDLFEQDKPVGLDIEQLKKDLLHRFQGQTLSFLQIQLQTLDWLFIEKHYRAAIKDLEGRGLVKVRRVQSKRGLQDHDLVTFP